MYTSASIGIAVGAEERPQELLRAADEAIYVEHKGKEDGVVRFAFEMIEGLRIVEDEEQHEDSPQDDGSPQ